MRTVSTKEKRNGIRIPLLSERVAYFVNGDRFEADVADITNEGVFLKTDHLIKPRSPVTITIQLPGDLGTLNVDGQAVRVNWATSRRQNRDTLGLGVRFQDLNPGTKKILDAYVVYLRNKQIINVSKRIIEEFFGNQGPNKKV